LIAADKYDADNVVLDSIAKTMDKNEFKETVRLLVTRGLYMLKEEHFR